MPTRRNINRTTDIKTTSKESEPILNPAPSRGGPGFVYPNLSAGFLEERGFALPALVRIAHALIWPMHYFKHDFLIIECW